MNLTDVAAELYRLPPREFTPARNARAKEAKDAGDRDAAREIAQLAKPSAAASSLNQLIAATPDVVDDFTSLGAALRQAQTHPDRATFADLVTQRRALVSATSASATQLAKSNGGALSAPALRELEQTLHASLADEDALGAAFSGLLVRGLESNGVDPVDLADAVAVPGATDDTPARASSPKSKKKPKVDTKAQQRRDAAADAVERAKKVAREKAAAVETLDDQLDEHAEAVEGLTAELEELRGRFEALERRQGELDERGTRLTRERARAVAAAERAQADADTAQSRLDRLTG
jgi:DNA repair exonuclease SbcCD ATPase subunit